MIDVSPLLLQHGRLLPLHPDLKKPWLLEVINTATNDPTTIAEWVATKPGCGWGLRIDSDELIVLDLERPGKGSACGGVRSVEWSELDAGQRLPFGPVATTQDGGQHRYYRLPEAYRGRLKNWPSVLPSVDLRVKGGMVCLPPSKGRMWIESLDDCDLPELPSWFCELILDGRAQSSTHTGQTESATDKGGLGQVVHVPHVPHFPGAGIKPNQWYSLFHSRDFLQVWSRARKMPRDNSQSSFEFSLSMRAFGLEWSREQVVTLLRTWWTTHGLAGDETRLVRRIFPGAWKASREFKEGREQDARDKQAAKVAAKTRTKILDYLRTHGPSTPKEVAIGIGITRAAAKMQLHRSGILPLVDHRYAAPTLHAPVSQQEQKQEEGSVIYPHSVTAPVPAKPMVRPLLQPRRPRVATTHRRFPP